MIDKIRVFVYGTLMSDRSNNVYLLDQKFIGSARLKGYAMYQVRSYPGIVPASGEEVLGEIYEIDLPTLSRLDKLEGEGYLYKRVEATAKCSGADHKVYVYSWLKDINNCRKIDRDEMPWNPVKEGCVV